MVQGKNGRKGGGNLNENGNKIPCTVGEKWYKTVVQQKKSNTFFWGGQRYDPQNCEK
jgi:hypothetical protein